MSKQQPGTSKASASSEFWKLSKEAKQKYGTASVRPQDADPGMLRFLRRTNLEIVSPFPDNYKSNLEEWIKNIPVIPILDLPRFSKAMITLQNAENQDPSILAAIRPASGKFSVLSVDFEFHQEISFDGYICVASVSSPEKTLVVDCLYENRVYAKTWLTKMLTGSRCLKVFCGMDNDVFRMQKDWSCFANGAIDIQDMYCAYKMKYFEDCYNTCRWYIKKRLSESKKDSSEAACRAYFQQLNKPGLDFLMLTFLQNDPTSKNKLATYADWRKRPLVDDLVTYSACDSYYSLKLFYTLYKKIGMDGLKRAAVDTTKKLLNRSSLPRYKDNVVCTAEQQWVVEKVLSWRKYLARNLDFKPEQIILGKNIPRLAQELHAMPTLDDTKTLAKLLEKYRVPDHFICAAKLLSAYLDRSGQSLVRMQGVICHNCNALGHVAKFCFVEPDPSLKRDFRSRPENFQRNVQQHERRRINFCLKYGKDPLTYTCPWESSPGVLRID